MSARGAIPGNATLVVELDDVASARSEVVADVSRGLGEPAGTSTVRAPSGAALVSEPNTWLTSTPGGTKPASRGPPGIVTSGSTGPDVVISIVLRFTAKLSVRTGRPGARVAFCPGPRRAAGPAAPATSRVPARVQQTKGPPPGCC